MDVQRTPVVRSSQRGRHGRAAERNGDVPVHRHRGQHHALGAPARGDARRARPPRRPAPSGHRSSTAATSSRRWATPSTPRSPRAGRRRGGAGRPARLQAEPWGEIGPLRVRMALHTGAAEERDGDYYGPALNRAARLLSTGHGGQVLLSEATAELVRDAPARRATACVDLGEHRLKDLIRPERVFQVAAPDLPADFPPLALARRPPEQPAAPARPASSAASRRWPSVKRLLGGDVAADADRAGRGRQDPPGAPGRGRRAGDVPRRRLAGRAGAAGRPGAGPAGGGGGARRPRAGRPPARCRRCQEYLRTRTLLLVLDNSSTWSRPAPPLADGLLRACPELAVLATSREALGIAGETTWRVPSLSLPDPQPGFGAAELAAALPQYEAVRLFVERARGGRSPASR